MLPVLCAADSDKSHILETTCFEEFFSFQLTFAFLDCIVNIMDIIYLIYAEWDRWLQIFSRSGLY